MIYLDHNATTPVDPRVLEVMLPLFTEQYLGPADTYPAARAAAELVDRATRQLLELTGAPGYDVVWTSGGGEAINLGLRGAIAGGVPAPGRTRVLVGATEHAAVLESARRAGAGGRGSFATVGVHRDGRLDLAHLDALLGADVALVAVTAANHETGTVNEVAEIARRARDAGALVFCDIVQAAGKIPIALADWGVDLAAVSAHKLYGPQGVGALVGRPDLTARLEPLLVGGAQQRGRRAGPVNTPGIVGFGRASELALDGLGARTRRQARLTRLLERLLSRRLPAVSVNGPDPGGRLPNTLSLRFAGAPADAVITTVPEVVLSTGVACPGTDDEPSHVLLAMGLDRAAARESLRFSLGRGNTEAEVRAAADLVARGVGHVRSLRGALARWSRDTRRRD